jgi:hypothetical protein
VISPSQCLYLNTGQHKYRINTYTHQTSIPCVGFESTIQASERAKTVHASDRSATVTGKYILGPQNLHFHNNLGLNFIYLPVCVAAIFLYNMYKNWKTGEGPYLNTTACRVKFCNSHFRSADRTMLTCGLD